jgi:signal transduction histidine kinase
LPDDDLGEMAVNSDQRPQEAEELADIAASLGAADLFVFRRAVGDRYVHVGGIGRGEGWAGNVEVSSPVDSVPSEATPSTRPVRIAHEAPTRIIGPYFARSAALVRVSSDVFVLFGHPAQALRDCSDEELCAAAEAAAEMIEFVSPAKRLADELELLHALAALRKTEARTVTDVMRHVVESAADSLSCELGLLYLFDREALTLAQRGWEIEAGEETLEAALATLRNRGEFPRCIQDVDVHPLPAPLTHAAGIRSYYLLPVGKPAIGLLLLMHTNACARGFTMLCQDLGTRLAEAAEEMLRSAFVRELEEKEAAALAEANERLRELDRMKDDFVALVTHELRTPLTSIRGYLELVLEEEVGALSAEQRHSLNVVHRNSERLLRLASDLMFVGRLDASGLELDQEELDLATIAGEAIESARATAEANGLALDLSVEHQPLVQGDSGRLSQLFDNLISNAIKFTPRGGRVNVRVTAGETKVAVEVADSGIGISAADQGRLFDRYFRASSATARGIGGTGLGLAISKAIVEAHRGEIAVESCEGEGTTFRVELPRRTATG